MQSKLLQKEFALADSLNFILSDYVDSIIKVCQKWSVIFQEGKEGENSLVKAYRDCDDFC